MAFQDCSPLYKGRPPWDEENPPIGGCKISEYPLSGSTVTTANGLLTFNSNIEIPTKAVDPATHEIIDTSIILTGKCTNEISVSLTQTQLSPTEFHNVFLVKFRSKEEKFEFDNTKILSQCTPNMITAIVNWCNSNSKLVNAAYGPSYTGMEECVQPFSAQLAGGDGPPQRPSPYVPPPAGINTGPTRSIAIIAGTDDLIQYDWDNDGWIPFGPDSDCRPVE